jgi:ketosteroid isomerase-like protein
MLLPGINIFVLHAQHEVPQMITKSEQEQILKLFEDGDRAIIAADVAELSRIYADDYVQYDEFGESRTKQDVVKNLETGAIRYLSMVSTGRRVRLLSDELAIVHGSEEDDVEQGGRRFPVRYIYMDVVVKREGGWQIVASQLARPI